MPLKYWMFTIMFIFFQYQLISAQSAPKTGIIKGTIIDRDTREALAGANIMIVNSTTGAAADKEGNYVINNVPVGFYTLEFSYVGYNSVIKTDVIVRSNRYTVVDAPLSYSDMESETIQVTSGYFSRTETEQVSSINFSAEEIRRSPGTAGDVSRIVMSLPSIAKINDQSNSLIVRGGSPLENGFYIDNIEIPNINHFPTQGSSGGPIGILNVDYIRDVNFYSGGFSAIYGNRLSSIMDISFREGTRDNFEGQLDLNFAGFGGALEGPLPAQKGSWMFAVKRSYLDFIIKAVDLGTSIAPVYGDFQGKVVYDLNQENQLTLLTVIGDDHSEATKKVARENNMTAFGKQNFLEATLGLNWRKIWQKSGYSNTSVSFTTQKYDNMSYETGNGYLLRTNDSREESFKIRNINHFRLNDYAQMDFGFEGKVYNDTYDSFYAAYTDILGNTTDEFQINKNLNTAIAATFFSLQYTFHKNLSLTAGIRANYYEFNSHIELAPRTSVGYKINESSTLKASYGIFYQQLPTVLLSQLKNPADVATPCARHTIFGFEQMITADTRLLVELYNKEYNNFPMDPGQADLFLVDELYYNGFDNFLGHNLIKSKGKARSYGFEITLQKKMAHDFYGLIAASWFRSQYKPLTGKWYNRVNDNRFTFSAEGGYKPSNTWEFSLRWIYAGGAPYTPFNQQMSEQLNRAIFDDNHINGKRYPDYHSLNIRFDRRFYFQTTNLVFYLSTWNAYDRKNIASYFWNQEENKKDVIYQWRMLPIFGLEYEF